MRIGILGAGNVGTRLAELARRAGQDVRVGTRSDAREVAAFAELLILAIPYTACVDALPPLAASLKGKIVVDATNPLNADWSPMSFSDESSAGEEIAKLLPTSRIVKAFNTVFADIMVPEKLSRNGQPVTTFLCGDDAEAKAAVSRLATSFGFEPLDAGPLRNSRYTEGIAHLNIYLAVALGGGTDATFLFHRSGRQA